MIGRVALVAILALSLPIPASAVTFGEIAAWCAPADKGGRPNLCSGYLDTESSCSPRRTHHQRRHARLRAGGCGPGEAHGPDPRLCAQRPSRTGSG